MIPKRGVAILVAMAVILAGVAIAMTVSDSSEVPLNSERGAKESSGGGEVKIKVDAGEVEDKATTEESG